jgi:hypothetical protein
VMYACLKYSHISQMTEYMCDVGSFDCQSD